MKLTKTNKSQSAAKCLTTDCDQPIHCRGVCARCLSRMAYSVKTGATTWRKLANAKMVLPSEGRGRKNSTIQELDRRNAAKRTKK